MTPSEAPGSADASSHWLESYPAHLSRTLTTDKGRTVQVRAIRHDDDELEEAFVRGLSRESGYQRLLGARKVTPEWVSSMTHVDYRKRMALVATTTTDGPEQFVGIARYVVDDATGCAEVAIVIADAWQGQGLGRSLLEVLLEHARASGVNDAEGVVLATNKAMLALARSVGFSVVAEPSDPTIVRIRRRLVSG
jgi:acetyltransferase